MQNDIWLLVLSWLKYKRIYSIFKLMMRIFSLEQSQQNINGWNFLKVGLISFFCECRITMIIHANHASEEKSSEFLTTTTINILYLWFNRQWHYTQKSLEEYFTFFNIHSVPSFCLLSTYKFPLQDFQIKPR